MTIAAAGSDSNTSIYTNKKGGQKTAFFIYTIIKSNKQR